MRRFAFVFFLIIAAVDASAAEECSNCNKLTYKENKGQWDNRVLFNADMRGGNVLLEKNAITYSLFSLEDLRRIRGDHHHQLAYKPSFDKTFHCHAFRITFPGASENNIVRGGNPIGEYFNYFIGNDKSKWASRVRGFREVLYPEIYKGIDLKVFSNAGNAKCDFILKPGVDVSQLKLRYEGTDSVALVENTLKITTSLGTAAEQTPYSYQIINGSKKEVECQYVLNGNEVSFSFPKGYDKKYELVIDPILIFSTFSGSFADNFGYSATYDSHKNAYAAGSVFINGPLGGYPVTTGAFQTTWAGGSGAQTLSGTDIGITKYSADGSTRIYSTYLGGASDELPHSLIVNSNDELFIFGTTSSNNFPVTANAYDKTYNGGPNPGEFIGLGVHYEFGSDIIITRLSNDGTQLLASTYLGGTGNDGLNISNSLLYNYADQVRGEIDIDKQNNVYVVTCTGSSDFPIVGSTFQPAFAGGTLDGVIIKMNNNLTNIIWSSYIGGEGDDAAYSVSLDKNDDLFITGGTASDSFPVTPGAFQSSNGGGDCDAFITHITKNGQQILASTYYGYSDYDQAFFIEINKADEVFVVGQAKSSDTNYIKNAIFKVKNGGLYISKFGFALDTIVWSTSLGKADKRPDISPTAFLVDLCNKVYVAGWGGKVNGAVGGSTYNLPTTTDAYQRQTDGSDFYLMVMKDDASALSYGTFIGGDTSWEHVDGGTSRFDRNGIVYQSVCAGCENSDSRIPHSDFPTTDSVVSRTNNSPNCNNAVFKFDFKLPIVLADFTVNSACAGFAATINNKSTASDTASFLWAFGDNTSSQLRDPQHTYSQSGLYTITLIVTDTSACNFSDTMQKQILIIAGNSRDTLPTPTICASQSVQIGLTPGTDSAVTYLWSPGNTLNETNVPNPIASPTATTTYQLLLSNGICTDTFFQTVSVFNDALSLSGSDALCPGDTLSLSVTNSQPNQQLTYSWQPASEIISGANTANPLVSPSQNSTYVVRVVNQFGCIFIDSIRVNVQSSLPNVNAIAVPDTIFFGDTSQLGLTSSSNLVYIQWANDTTLSATNIENPLTFPPSTHTYYVEVADAQGCRKTDSVTVYVIHSPCKEANIYIPNAFSPNADGKNDVLYVRANNLTAIYFTVYDRWGQKVFETKDQSKGWDGTFKNKKLDPAVFGWYAEGVCEGGDKFFKKGNVTLLQ